MEAAFSIHDNSSLRLYDCLVPTIRDRMIDFGFFCDDCKKKTKQKGIMFSPLNMIEMKQRNQMWESKLPELEKENQELRLKVMVQ